MNRNRIRRRPSSPAMATAALAVVLSSLAPFGPGSALAQAPDQGILNDTPTRVVLWGEPTDANTVVAAPAPASQEAGAALVAASAGFQATYSGFSAAAQGAFQRAMDIWGSVLNSSVPIRIVARFQSMPAGSLGVASYRTTANFPGAPHMSTFYPLALANALAGTDLNPDLPDIEIDVNSTQTWHFGTGPPPSGTFDFTSTVLHEIGHGLGFGGSMTVSSGQGRWGSGTPPLPDIYDRFTTDGSRRSLINTSVYPNPSAALATALQSGNVFFDSPLTNAADGTGRPRLHAPATWQQGASYSHLDEATYPAGNPNSLMTPTLFQNEAVHSPGPLTLCIFEALGWVTSENCPPTAAATPTTTVSPTSLETGQAFTTSATGVPTANTPYVVKISTLASNCPTGRPTGSGVTSTAARSIPATQRFVPHTVTSGARFVCWVSTEDTGDHSPAVEVIIF